MAVSYIVPPRQPKIHGLSAEMNRSMRPELLAWWDAIYHKTFANIVRIERMPTGTAIQKSGIDVILHRENGTQIAIDEKTRDKDYGDLLLEFESTAELPGWIEKDAPIDWLFYGVYPQGEYWALPWPILKSVWLEQGEAWLKRYHIKQAHNKSPQSGMQWVSRSVAVPWNVILSEVGRKMVGSLKG